MQVLFCTTMHKSTQPSNFSWGEHQIGTTELQWVMKTSTIQRRSTKRGQGRRRGEWQQWQGHHRRLDPRKCERSGGGSDECTDRQPGKKLKRQRKWHGTSQRSQRHRCPTGLASRLCCRPWPRMRQQLLDVSMGIAKQKLSNLSMPEQKHRI